jgi:hypothetical protein
MLGVQIQLDDTALLAQPFLVGTNVLCDRRHDGIFLSAAPLP